MSEWKTTLRILAKQPNFSMDFTKLTQELTTQRVLGFNADPNGSPDEYLQDIVHKL